MPSFSIPHDVYYHADLSAADKLLYPLLGKQKRLRGIYEVSYRNLAERSGLDREGIADSFFRYAAAGFVEVIGTTSGRNGGIAYRIKQKSSTAAESQRSKRYVKSAEPGSERPADLNGQQILKLKSEMIKDRYAGCHNIIRYLFP